MSKTGSLPEVWVPHFAILLVKLSVYQWILQVLAPEISGDLCMELFSPMQCHVVRLGALLLRLSQNSISARCFEVLHADWTEITNWYIVSECTNREACQFSVQELYVASH